MLGAQDSCTDCPLCAFSWVFLTHKPKRADFVCPKLLCHFLQHLDTCYWHPTHSFTQGEEEKYNLAQHLQYNPPRFSTYFSWIFRTRWTMGISLPSILKTTISPTLMGSSIRFVRNSRSPLWNAGSMLPLQKKRRAVEQELNTQNWVSEFTKNLTRTSVKSSQEKHLAEQAGVSPRLQSDFQAPRYQSLHLLGKECCTNGKRSLLP